MTDTLFGVLSWDPAVVPLEVHVFGAIRCRTKNDRIRAQRFRHHSIDAVGAGDSSTAMSAAMCEVETSLAASHVTPSPESLTFSGEVLDHVRDLAARDRDILRIIDAIEAGATEPAEIMSLARMSEKTYKKARLRLGRVVEQLSNHVLLGARRHA